ncbi:MAG: DUF1289 domain-containing protein [Leptospiraceae bacterium]|nr:DUF1289 domain-containing protein [Leptospiraceae bacterium]
MFIETKLINSPCTKRCQLDENETCIGCFRTVEEIANWLSYTNREKERILERIQNQKKF